MFKPSLLQLHLHFVLHVVLAVVPFLVFDLHLVHLYAYVLMGLFVLIPTSAYEHNFGRTRYGNLCILHSSHAVGDISSMKDVNILGQIAELGSFSELRISSN
jgi:hypothetical protein